MEYLKKLLKFSEKLKNVICGVLLYGSFVRKEKANDLDILIIVDDDATEFDIMKLRSELEELEREFKRDGIVLHYQPPKTVTQIWLMILKAEPWIITAMDEGKIVYQRDKLLEQMKQVAKNIKFVFGERVERLIERARRELIDIREYKKNMFISIAESVIDMAQLLLFFDKKIVFDRKRIAEELKKSYQEVLGPYIEDFIDICIIYDKIVDGKLTDLSMEEIEHYLKKARNFLERAQKVIHFKMGREDETKRDIKQGNLGSKLLRKI